MAQNSVAVRLTRSATISDRVARISVASFAGGKVGGRGSAFSLVGALVILAAFSYDGRQGAPGVERVRPSLSAQLASYSQRGGGPTAAGAAAFGTPVVGYEIISPFGLRQLPWEHEPRLHAGVDIAAPRGTPVLAVLPGVVRRLGYDGGYGRFIELEHENGVRSLYAHLDYWREGLKAGLRLHRGAFLGGIGSTGSSTGAHLHFEVRAANGRPLDPFYFLGRSFDTAGDWPLEAASRISTRVRYAQVGTHALSAQELLIASRETLPLDAQSPERLADDVGDQAMKVSFQPPAESPEGLQASETAGEAVDALPRLVLDESNPDRLKAEEPIAAPQSPAPKPRQPRAAFPTSF